MAGNSDYTLEHVKCLQSIHGDLPHDVSDLLANCFRATQYQ